MPIDSHPDHVAIAVADHEPALARWRDHLGAGEWSQFHNPGMFRGRQLKYANGAKLEILMPSEEDDDPHSFLRGFLAKFGSRVHHVTLKVPDLASAIPTLEDAGFDPVDVDLSNEHWRELFLRPSQIGGIVVQVASSSMSEEEWNEHTDQDATEPTGTAELVGPLLAHPDLDRSAEVWSALGADVDRRDDAVVASWSGHPLEVMIVHGSAPDALGLRFRGTGEQPADPVLGPAIVEA